MKRNIQVQRKPASATANVKTVHDGAQRKVRVTRTARPGAPKTLWFFQQTPGGNLLRAYMCALILAQIGTLKAGAPFKLWPYANVAGHLANRRMERGEAKGTYKLTQSGVTYLTDDRQKPDASTLEGMTKAVKEGVKPSFYRFELSQMNL